MKRTLLLSLTAAVVVLGMTLRADQTADKKAILDTLQTMRAAYAAKDVATLETVFHRDLVYGHTTGHIENKATVLKVATERVVLAMDFAESLVVVTGDVAQVRGIGNLTQAGEEAANGRGQLWLLVRGGGPHGWQIIGRQNWRPAEELQVLATLEALSQANIKQDRKSLETLLHANLTYGHSGGTVQNKVVAIDYMLARDTTVLRWESPRMTTIGAMTMVRAKQVVQIVDRKTKKATDSASNVLWVLVKGAGPHGWQIAARQNFRPDAEKAWLSMRDVSNR